MNIHNNVSSIKQQFDTANTNATNIANSNNKEADIDLTKEMVELIPISKVVEANAVAIKTQDETTKNLLDIIV
ncbi:MAG: hypothetical protein OIF32_12720 [Campylobacterales bacterium]|nr:hypothetical protein [Campylobacterales bacterium]